MTKQKDKKTLAMAALKLDVAEKQWHLLLLLLYLLFRLYILWVFWFPSLWPQTINPVHLYPCLALRLMVDVKSLLLNRSLCVGSAYYWGSWGYFPLWSVSMIMNGERKQAYIKTKVHWHMLIQLSIWGLHHISGWVKTKKGKKKS